MQRDSACHLTTKDVTILEGLLATLESRAQGNTPIVSLLRRKLAHAQISFREDIAPCIATINSRVEFRVDNGPVQASILTLGGEYALPGATLSVSTLRGLALLGLTEGQSITIDRLDGRTEVLRLERILHQPEFARRAKAEAKVVDGLRYPNARAAWSQTKRRTSFYGPDDNDPGPSAA
jgi:regulator of nucleoside diphosphate kinase